MALTRVAPAGIGSTPGTGYVIGDSFLHATGLNATNAYYTGIVTAQTFRVIGDFQVDGTTTTLDTVLTEVDKLEVGANNNTVGVAITQSGSGDILNLYDGGTEVFTVTDGGKVGIGITNPTVPLFVQADNPSAIFKLASTTATSGYHFAFGWADNSLYHRIRTAGGANDGFIIENINSKVSQYFASSGDWTLKTNSSTRLTVTSTGNVGINKASPSRYLEIGGTSNNPQIRLSNGSGTSSLEVLGNAASGQEIRFGTEASPQAGRLIYHNSDNSLRYDRGGERLRVTSAGNVGIGLTNPDWHLDIKSTSVNAIVRLKSSGSTNGGQLQVNSDDLILRNRDAGELQLWTNDSNKLTIKSDGNVGVGDDNPSVPFNVKAGGASFAGQTTHVKIEDTTSLAVNVGGLLAFEGVYNSNGDPACYAMIHGGKTNADNGNYAGYLRFFTRPNGALPQERLRITSSGVVGINTDVSGNGSGGKLVVGGRIQSNAGGYWFAGANGAEDGWHVQDSGGNLVVVESGVAERLRITSAGQVIVNGTTNLGHPNMDDIIVGDASGNRGITVASGTSNYGTLAFGDSTDGSGNDRYQGFIEYYHSDNSMRLGTVAQERLRISSTGNIGIGENNPAAKLDVKDSQSNTVDIRLRNTESNAQMSLYAFGGSAGTGSHFNNRIAMMSWNSTEGIDIIANGTGDNDFRVYTAGYGTNSERFRITSGGQVQIPGGSTPFKVTHTGGDCAQFHRGSKYLGINADWGGNTGDSVITASTNLVFHTNGSNERLRITSAGLIGINATDPRTGLTISKWGTAPTTNANTYSMPAGRWVSTWNTGTANNTDYWAGFGGSGYAVSSGSVNIALAPNHNNTSQQAGMYIAGEATSVSSADFTIGKLVAGSATGSSDVAGNQRATKSELMRVTSDGKVGINNTNPQTTLNVQGTISTGRNLAREVGTVISSSTNFNSYRDAENVLNGKKNYENGNNDWLTAGNNRANANLVIDLGAQYDIDRVVIYNQNEYDDSRREVKRFNLEGSNDNSSWTLLIDDELGRSDAHEPNPGFSFRLPHVSSPGGMHDDNEGVGYRYWRFTMKDFHGSDPYGGIMEIELYGASNAVDSEVSTHSLVASDVYTQTLSAQRLAIGENGALGDFRANQNENVYINAAARFGQNTSDSSGNATRHTGWRMYGYNPAGVSARYQWSQDGFHGRKSFYYYFPNNSANQAIRFHSNRSSFWTCGFITINALYSHQNAAGMLRYHFQHNANGTSNYGKSIEVDVNIGNTSGNVGMSNSYTFKSWGSNGGSTTSHALELRHLTSTGNGFYITFELYGNHLYNHMDDLYMTTGHTY